MGLFTSSSCLFVNRHLLSLRITLLPKYLNESGTVITLNDDLAILDSATYAATLLEEFGKGLQIGIASDEATHKGHCLATSSGTLHAETQALL